jgi:hypothetical protein
MGWGMSMGIGWPNASAQSNPIPPSFTGYFGFFNYCNGDFVEQTYYGPTTQTWQVGQIVQYPDSPYENNYVIINSIRASLDGEFYPIVTLQGPALNGCPA